MKSIGWFSGGVTSACAIKVMLDAGHELDIIYFETGSHHPDHKRFLADCEKWYGQKIEILQNPNYESVDDVIRKDRFINGPFGARCTKVLKKDLRIQIEKEREYDRQVFGFEDSPKEINRAIRFQQQYPDARATFPLIYKGMSKEDCKEMVLKAGIKLPAMYGLGFSNSNCIGCVKGGKKYWGAIRHHFPEQFALMAQRERELGRSCIKDTFLDELDEKYTPGEKVSVGECGVVCEVETEGLSVITDKSLLEDGIHYSL